VNPLKQWRSWVLVLLFIGPIIVYACLGMLWLWQRGWTTITAASLAWLISGVLFALLAARWTKPSRMMMPPLDWDAPQTFAPRDREAWKIVEEEADKGETIAFAVLLGSDVYINSGIRLFRRLSKHYHPDATHPLDYVPLVELLTALELAAEDLSALCRQVPGGDLIALSHWRRAVQVAGYITWASDIYSYLSPLLNPVTGLARLGTQRLLVKPAWKSAQQNMLRWLYEAYLNRLGMHFIELLSGRLAIGADHYRRLTRRTRVADALAGAGAGAGLLGPLTFAVAGMSGSGKSRLTSAVRAACSNPIPEIKERLARLGIEPAALDRLAATRWIEAPALPASGAASNRRDRAAVEAAIAAAVEGDLLMLVVDGKADHSALTSFAQAWDRWFRERPHRDVPPALVVLTGVDRAEYGGGWAPPYDWAAGMGFREKRVRAAFDSLRSVLPPTFHEFIAVGMGESAPYGVAEQLVPALAALSIRAERIALLRRLQEVSGQSKLGRLMRQLGQQGRWLVGNLRARSKAGTS
jgi:hypothetical protein